MIIFFTLITVRVLPFIAVETLPALCNFNGYKLHHSQKLLAVVKVYKRDTSVVGILSFLRLFIHSLIHALVYSFTRSCNSLFIHFSSFRSFACLICAQVAANLDPDSSTPESLLCLSVRKYKLFFKAKTAGKALIIALSIKLGLLGLLGFKACQGYQGCHEGTRVVGL